ncbi:hypothetical protein MKW98_013522 [Papaver atlanticum]|uniref:Uncharacterized protein n=1 Tax=Papaver atlanticum TaxID=357466 RepID=A0AAD4XJ56_9MAGN|nr:hypothetical protein MKW98_013522 [Papaver atlanticum]
MVTSAAYKSWQRCGVELVRCLMCSQVVHHPTRIYAVLMIAKKDQEGQSQVLSVAIEIAEGSVDVDSKFRALVVVGSLV